MTRQERINQILTKIETDAARKTAAITEAKDKEKIKPLTQAERLDRIEKILGIV
jgi:hypothetical protein